MILLVVVTLTIALLLLTPTLFPSNEFMQGMAYGIWVTILAVASIEILKIIKEADSGSEEDSAGSRPGDSAK